MVPIKFFEHMDIVQDAMRGKAPVIFLDYDGTLTPIVATPDLAILSEDMREAVRCLSARCTVAIVSGRATDDVRSKVGLSGFFYAGSHGFEIVDPSGNVKVNEQAAAIRPVIDAVQRTLAQRVQHIPGALIEHVKYTVSCHYRLITEEHVAEFEQIVSETMAEYPQLRMTHGKKVFELRPDIAWDKGKAVDWILGVLNFDPQTQIAVYIGDDTTDEDAFTILAQRGVGILVANPAKDSAAKFVVDDVGQVKKVLEFLSLENTAPDAR